MTRPAYLLRVAAAVLSLGVVLPAAAAQAAPLQITAQAVAPAVVNTTPPVLFGTTVVGQTIAFSTGYWSPAGLTFAYQWRVAGVDVPGATANSFPLTADYVGKVVSATVTGSKTGYTSTTVTAVAGTVQPGTVANSAVPTVVGTAKVGYTLGLHSGSWTPGGLTFTYQWNVNGVNVPGATGTSFPLTADHVGKAISVSVTGSRAGFVPTTATSSPTTAVRLGSVSNHTKPRVVGTLKVGHTVGLRTGIWSPSGLKFTYRWLLNGHSISHQTGRSLKIKPAYKGQRISVRVTVTRTGYASAAAISSMRSKVIG